MSRIRIVGGRFRSRLIEVPDSFALRPTPDRVRETLFNWLGQDLSGQNCLDLFAGSGALGFEAASRNAASVVMVEMATKVLAHLRKTQAALDVPEVRIVSNDALKFLAAHPGTFDVVFLDPPFHQGWLERLAPLVENVLAPNGRVYVESETPVPQLGNLGTIKSGKAGQVHYQLLAKPAIDQG